MTMPWSGRKRERDVEEVIPLPPADSDSDSRVDSGVTAVDSNSLLPARAPVLVIEDHTVRAISRNDDDSRRIQEQTTFWNKLKWADHVQDKFRERLNMIDKANQRLRGLLKQRNAKYPHTLISGEDLPAASQPEYAEILENQLAVATLHNTLGSANALSEEARAFCIDTRDDFSQNWVDAKAQKARLPVRNGGLMMFVQSQESSQSADSIFLMMELLRKSEQSGPAAPDGDMMANFDNLGYFSADETTSHSDYQAWGCIRSEVPSEKFHDTIQAFCATSPWRKTGTLLHHMTDPSFLAELDLSDLLFFLIRIVRAHLNLARISQSCSNPRLESFVYFESTHKAARQHQGKAAIHEPLWQRPFLACGIGEAAPEVALGEGTGRRKDPDSGIVELGLLLYQLGGRTVLELGAETGITMSKDLRAAKKTALLSLVDVERNCTAAFANIVEACLCGNAETESAILWKSLKALKALKVTVDNML